MADSLHLHSSIVQTRDFGSSTRDRREAVRYAIFDSTLALGFALFINAAILVLGAAAFHTRGLVEVAEIADAYKLLSPVLGVSFASTLFACALLASGQNSTLRGTLAGQMVMEGFVELRFRPWLREEDPQVGFVVDVHFKPRIAMNGDVCACALRFGQVLDEGAGTEAGREESWRIAEECVGAGAVTRGHDEHAGSGRWRL